jgi:hypothetical protein
VSDLLVLLERSALGDFVRTSSLWTYPLVNLLHIFGIASLFGATLIVDLRLLGLWKRVPLAHVTDVAVPIAALGLGLAACTGVGLLAANATEYDGNLFLLGKFGAIALGLVNVAALSASPAWKARRQPDLPPRARRALAIYGGISLAAWIAAVTAGRLIAYW